MAVNDQPLTENDDMRFDPDADPHDAYEAGVRMGWALAETHHGLSSPPEQENS